jgi:DNA-binding response OmpR family regulator
MKKILLADDEENLRLLLRTTLESPEWQILDVADGANALATALRELPDVIVLDWMMPGMTGIEVARRLREKPDTASIPIILLTAKGQVADRAVGRELGVAGYLVKPFSPLELLEHIEAILA